MINPPAWRKARRKLLEQVKAEVRLRLGPEPAPLRAYRLKAARDFSGRWRSATHGDLRAAVADADVVLGADFHAYQQAQRAHVRVLRDHVPGRRVVLALECVRPRDEAAVEEFLRGGLSEAELLRRTRWAKTWGFPWSHYRALFELARARGFQVRGLGRPDVAHLPARDRWMAARIERVRRECPRALVYAVVGEWHLAQAHLPKLLNARTVVIFQDAEPLYARLVRQKREHDVELLRRGNNIFCLMVSPPWMKWQSYLMYLEQAYDQDLQDELSIDYTEHVVSIIKLLAGDLKIRIKTARVEVYGPSSGALGRLRLPSAVARALLHNSRRDRSFYLAERGWLYLSRPTMNHASQVAGQFIHAQLSKRQRSPWGGGPEFLALIWVEAVGFFFSKWMNPKRKPESLKPRPLTREPLALRLALDQRLCELAFVRQNRVRPRALHPRGQVAYLEAARIAGSLLGEKLFQSVRARTISLPRLMSYLKIRVDDDKFPVEYWNLIRELEQGL